MYGLSPFGSGNFGVGGEFGAVIATSSTRVGNHIEFYAGLRSSDTSTMVVGPTVESTGIDVGARSGQDTLMKIASSVSFTSGIRGTQTMVIVSSGVILWDGIDDPTGTWTDITNTI